ncbi:MAG: 4Fe-4S binding protein [Pseudomonadota bacterium]
MKNQYSPDEEILQNKSLLYVSIAAVLQMIIFVICLLFAVTASAGVLSRDDIVKKFPTPYIVGDKDSTLPVWPIFQQNATENRLAAYVFESADLAPIPGFSGVPVNLLIAIDPAGQFLNVQVISQHEPVFLDGLGEAPLLAFVAQYKNLSLKQGIRILTSSNTVKTSSAESVELDGVAKATASVRIINQTILSSTLKVARKKLGFSQGSDPELTARIKADVLENHSVDELIDKGLLKHFRLLNSEIEAQFKNSNGAGLDTQGLAQPDSAFIDLYFSLVSVPSIGRSLLTETSWRKLQGRLDPGDHALLLMTGARHGVLSEVFTRGNTPDQLVLKQNQLPIEMRDLNLELKFKDQAQDRLGMTAVSVFRVISQAGLDPATKLDFSVPVTRLKGMIYPEKITREFVFDFKLPERFFTVPQNSSKSWEGIWLDRWLDIFILLLGLLILFLALGFQKKLVTHERRFFWFRNVYLLFTLLFIGWHAQGQLSIVNFTSVVQALLAGRDLGFLLYDPITVTLWVFVAISLVVWGRGTFCGWLCPFGALQELMAKAAVWFKLPQLKIKNQTDRQLKSVKYLVLAAILLSPLVSARLTDSLVEIEPFKTAITLNFARSWPFVLYAAGLLLASMFVYKSFCRYLCPFGAGLALLGRLRVLDWIPRREACGTPCQTCRYQCEYQSISPVGKIEYTECFQCMDCVIIHDSDDKCAPLLLEKKRNKIIPVTALPL